MTAHAPASFARIVAIKPMAGSRGRHLMPGQSDTLPSRAAQAAVTRGDALLWSWLGKPGPRRRTIYDRHHFTNIQPVCGDRRMTVRLLRDMELPEHQGVLPKDSVVDLPERLANAFIAGRLVGPPLHTMAGARKPAAATTALDDDGEDDGPTPPPPPAVTADPASPTTSASPAQASDVLAGSAPPHLATGASGAGEGETATPDPPPPAPEISPEDQNLLASGTRAELRRRIQKLAPGYRFDSRRPRRDECVAAMREILAHYAASGKPVPPHPKKRKPGFAPAAEATDAGDTIDTTPAPHLEPASA